MNSQRLGLVAGALEWAPWVLDQEWHSYPSVQQRVMHHARRYNDQLWGLKFALKSGAKRRREAQNAVLESNSGRFCCLVYAAGQRGQKLSLGMAEDISNDIWVRQDCGEVMQLREVPKPNGEMRQTIRFGIRRGALSYLCRDVLLLTLGAPDDEFMWPGRGLDRAVGCLREAIEGGLDWVGTADIKNCYPSFRHEGIKAEVRLPDSVIRNVILIPKDAVILNSYGVPISKSDRDTLRQGLPPGAPASGVIASHLLSVALAPIGHDILLLRYADNLAWAGGSKPEVDATKDSLIAHLSGHPVGELTLHCDSVRHSDEGVSFLGYRIVTDPDADSFATRAFPNAESFERLFKRLTRDLERCAPALREDLAISSTISWIVGKRHWTPSADRIDHVVGQALALVPKVDLTLAAAWPWRCWSA